MGVFDDIALTYDDTIDWEARLKREMPFLLDTLGEPAGKRILDLACGTGRHSIEFSSLGGFVTGIDISEAMLKRAKSLAEKRGVQPRFIEADMLDVDALISEKFHLVLCLGNSLSLVRTFEDQRTLLNRVYESLAKKGIFVAQILNFEEIRKSMFKFFPLRIGTSQRGDSVVFFRFFEHSHDSTSDLFFVAFVHVDDDWQSQISMQRVLNMNEESVTALFIDAGFSEIEIFAGYNKEAFRHSKSRNIIVRARK